MTVTSPAPPGNDNRIPRPGVWTSVAAVAAFSVAIRLPFLNIPMFSDEGAYAYIAWFWAQGDRLYTDLLIFRPQAIVVLYRTIFATLGPDLEDIRLFAALYNALTLVLVFLIARCFVPARYALLGAFLFAVFSVGRVIEGITANGEIFLNLPATACAYALLRVARGAAPLPGFAVAGVLAGIAAQLKPSGIAALALGIMVAVVLARQSGGRLAPGLIVRYGMGLGLGFALSLVPAVVHGLLTGWDTFFTAAIGFSLVKASPTSQPPLRFVARAGISLALFLIDHVLLVHMLLGRLMFPRLRPAAGPEWFVWLWLLSAGLGIAAGGSWWMHYYIQAIPSLSVLAAVSIYRIAGTLKRDVAGVLWLGSGGLAAVYTVVLFTQPFPLIFVAEARDAAAYVAERTTPDDRIHVAGSDPEIYFQARRRAAYRYLFLAEPELPRVPEAMPELAALLGDPARRPAYVLVPPGGMIKGWETEVFFRAVEENYLLERQIGRVFIYRKRAG